MTEHPLYRDELVEAVVPLLASEDPIVRVLACQAFERLGSRRALPFLGTLLSVRDRRVVTAARAAITRITGVEFPASATPRPAPRPSN